MIFEDWKEIDVTDVEISPTLLWEYDLDNFDWEKGKIIVVQRIIERGWRKDWYKAIHIYGGLDNFINIVKQVPSLNKRDMNYVSVGFNIKLEELECYKRIQRRKKLFNSYEN